MSHDHVMCHVSPVACQLSPDMYPPSANSPLCRVSLFSNTQIPNKITSDGRFKLPSFVFQCY